MKKILFGVFRIKNINFLNSKEIKELKKKLLDEYGFSGELDYGFLITETNKIYLINRDITRIDFKILKINNMGLYFCQDYGNELRLSIEGSQIIGPNSTKIVELDKKTAREWLKGFDIAYDGATKGFVIIKSGNDYMGCAKHKDGKLLNYVPKERRIKASD